jgi:heme exporter protein D
MSEIFAMGNYGAYVWSCFGLTLAVLVICVVQGAQRHKSVLNDVKTRIRAMESDT